MDNCKNCTLRGDITKCEEHSCSVRCSWYVESLRAKLAEAEKDKARMLLGLEDAKLFAKIIETIGRTECEIYRHELKSSADLAIERIDAAIAKGEE